MRHAIHDERHNETFPLDGPPGLREEERQCALCAHWDTASLPVRAVAGARRLAVRQCLRAGLGDAPLAQVMGPFEAAVFTNAESRCADFSLCPDAARGLAG